MRATTCGVHVPSGVPAAAGTIAHQAIGDALAGDVRADSLDALDSHVRELCGTRDGLNNRRVRVLAFTSACKYLSLLRPTVAEFLGAEVTLGGGFADLMWLLPDGDIFVDELKTERYLNEDAAATQVTRYVTAGRDLLGGAFVGVRVIATTHQRRSLFVDTSLQVMPLAESAYSIDAMRRTAGDGLVV